jgi:hypothetical protein
MRTFLVIALALIAIPAAAQDQDRTLLNTATWMFAASAASDQASTVYVAHHEPAGYVFAEADPLYSRWTNNLPMLCAASTGVDVASTLAIRHFLGQKHPRIASALLFGMASVRFGTAWHNIATLPTPTRPVFVNTVNR